MMKLLILINLWGAAGLISAATSMEASYMGSITWESLDVAEAPSSSGTTSTQQWKVGDPCEADGVGVSYL